VGGLPVHVSSLKAESRSLAVPKSLWALRKRFDKLADGYGSLAGGPKLKEPTGGGVRNSFPYCTDLRPPSKP